MGSADYFARLPPELVKEICEFLLDRSISTLSAFASIRKRKHGIANSILYKYDLDVYLAYGLFWAAKHGRVELFDKFLQYGGRAYVNDTIFSVEACSGTPEHQFMLFRLLPELSEIREW